METTITHNHTNNKENSYSSDPIWREAKKVAGSAEESGWIETVSYYREQGGYKVFVYSLINKSKNLIVDVTNTEEILLLDSNNKPFIENYKTIKNSRKYFSFNEEPFYTEVTLQDYRIGDGSMMTFKIPVERITD